MSVLVGLLIGFGLLMTVVLAYLSESTFLSLRRSARATIAALQSRLADALNQLEAVGTDVAQWAAHLSGQDRQLIRRLLIAPDGHATLTDAVLDRIRAQEEVSEIHRVWLTQTNDTQTWENRCVDHLGVAIPYLFPELKPRSKLFLRKAAKTFLRDAYNFTDEYLEQLARTESQGGYYKLPCNPDMQPDVCGLFEVDTSFSLSLRGQRDVILIIEAKNPDRAVDEWVMEEAFSYAYDVYRMVRSETPIHFECLAVAGELKKDLRVPSGRLEGCGPASIRLTATTWKDLHERVLRSSRVARYPLPVLV